MADVPFTIYEAALDDLDLIAPLFDGYRQFYGQASDLDGARAFLRARLELDESVILLAVHDGVGLGFIQLYPSFSSVTMQRLWTLNDLYVAPAARRQGVATDLLEAARQYAIETESKGLELATAPDNTAAQALYEALGWQRDSFYHYYLHV